MKLFFKKSTFFIQLLLCCSLLLTFNASARLIHAANAKKVIGKVTVTRANHLIRIKSGSKLYKNDVINTTKKGQVMIIFRDRTKFVLGRNSSMTINKFSYRKKKKDNMFISILRGSFRFVSGIMAKKRHHSMRVKVGRRLATIGIRGTHVAGEVIGDSSSITLLEPEEEEKEIIAVAKVELAEEVEQTTAITLPIIADKKAEEEKQIEPKNNTTSYANAFDDEEDEWGTSQPTVEPPVIEDKDPSQQTKPKQQAPIADEDKVTVDDYQQAVSEMDAPSSIKVENDYGSVIIDKAGYGTTIPDAHSPPTPMRRMKLRTINNLMRSMQRARRMRHF